MSELVGVLEKTAVPQELQNAQKYLENAAQTNLPLFLKELSKGKLFDFIAIQAISVFLCHVTWCVSSSNIYLVVASTETSPYARTAGCLQMKNYLTSHNQQVKQQHQQNWLQIGQQDRMEIKQNAFMALGSEQK